MNFNIFSQYSIKTKITVTTLIIFVISIWSLELYATRMLREDVQRLLSEKQFSAASFMAAAVNDDLDERLRLLEEIAKQITPSLLGKPVELQALLEQRPILQIQFNSGAFVVGIDGVAIASLPLSLKRVGVNYMERDFIVAALKKGKATIGAPVIGKQLHAPIFVIGVPVRDAQGTVIGALSGVTDLSKASFIDKISEGNYGKKGSYYLLVAKPQRQIVTSNVNNRVMEKLPVPGVIPAMDHFLQGHDGSAIYINPFGVEVLASYKNISVADWIVIAATPTKVAFAPIHSMQRRMLLAAILLTLVISTLTWWITRRQLAPMLTALNALNAMPDKMQPLPVTSQDEIGQLVTGFNRLLENLEERTNKLANITQELTIILENAPFGISKIIDRKQVWVNHKVLEILQYSREEIEHQTTRKLYPSDEAYERLGQEAYPALAKGIVFETVQELVRKDGSHNLVRYIGKALEPPDMSKGTIWLLEDITERTHMEEALRESELRYRTVAEFTSDWEYWITPDGSLRYISPSCEEISGYSPDEFYSDPQLLTRIIHPEDNSVYSRHSHTINAHGTPEPVDYRIVAKQGECRWVSHVCRTVYDDAGNSLGQRASNRDITERKQAEAEIIKLNEDLEIRVLERTAELERMNKELEEFCYAITHEFRAPLARMEGFSRIMKDAADTSNRESVIHCADRIDVASSRLRSVIDSLLALNRISRADISRYPVNLSEMSMQIVTKLLEQHDGRSIAVTIAPDIVVQGDRHMLEICMRNLLANAIKYTAKTSHATVEFGKLNIDGVDTFFVRDNGVGFDMSHVKNLFVPFCRLHTQAEFEGTGIDLATVHRIIEKHGGRIWAEAEPGNGATFYFTINHKGGADEKHIHTVG